MPQSYESEFDGPILRDAVINTFRRRSTALSGGRPLAFTEEFRKDAQKQAQWRAFVRKSKPEDVSEDLAAIIEEVEAFLMPVIAAAQGEEPFRALWRQNGPWSQVITD